MAVAAAAAPRLPAPARLLVAFVSAAGARASSPAGRRRSPTRRVETLAAALAIMRRERRRRPLHAVGRRTAARRRSSRSRTRCGSRRSCSRRPGAPTLGAAAGALCWQLARRLPADEDDLQRRPGRARADRRRADLGARRDRRRSPTRPTAWALGAAAAGAAFLVNATTVALVIALVGASRSATMLFGSLRVSSLQWLGNLAIGLLAALAWHVNPAGLVLVAVPLGLVYLAYREWVAGLVEREQMEDMARTAERIARDGDPAARLPMAGREGRLAQLTASLNRMLEQLDRAFGRDRHLHEGGVGRAPRAGARDPPRARAARPRGRRATRPPPRASGCTATSTASTRC